MESMLYDMENKLQSIVEAHVCRNKIDCFVLLYHYFAVLNICGAHYKLELVIVASDCICRKHLIFEFTWGREFQVSAVSAISTGIMVLNLGECFSDSGVSP